MRMSRTETQDTLIDRMRANLREAGIPLEPRDLERIVETGMLQNALAFEALEAKLPGDLLPDYLRSRGPAPAPPAPHASAAAQASRAAAPRADSIAAIAPRLGARAVSAVELTRQSLERIAVRDAALNAFQCVLADRALAAARAADEEIAAGRYRGPLHGVPVAIKDLLALRGTPTTAGSKILAGVPAEADAEAVARLERAGAIIVGKTRMPEFAYSPGSNNPHYGPTHNPHDPSRDAGGSSSGSGAGVADGMMFAALGSDTGGSIRIPAALCGIVGFKPTHGRVSLDGAVPLSWSLDHLGPMTRSVTDAALVLEAIAGYDSKDSRTRAVPVPPYARGLDQGVRGLRIGVLGDDGAGEPLGTPEVEAAWRGGLKALAAAGAELVPVDLAALAEMRVVNYALLAVEAAIFHRRWLRERAQDYGEFARIRLLAAHAFGHGALIRAQQARAALRAAVEARCEGLDLLSMPTMPDIAPPLGIPASTRFTAPFNFLGWPALTLPVGRTGAGMPLAMQLVGRPWTEEMVLRAGWVVEAATALAA
jgi:aspartyl-tRNA(Asn)/glutamyl-tRNA(Gln) amidotransferase subunit A